jgi:hypothetical protein
MCHPAWHITDLEDRDDDEWDEGTSTTGFYFDGMPLFDRGTGTSHTLRGGQRTKHYFLYKDVVSGCCFSLSFSIFAFVSLKRSFCHDPGKQVYTTTSRTHSLDKCPMFTYYSLLFFPLSHAFLFFSFKVIYCLYLKLSWLAEHPNDTTTHSLTHHAFTTNLTVVSRFTLKT